MTALETEPVLDPGVNNKPSIRSVRQFDEFCPETPDAIHSFLDRLGDDESNQPPFDTEEVGLGRNAIGRQDELGDLSVLPCKISAMVALSPLGELGARFVKAPNDTKSVQHHHARLTRDFQRQALHVRARDAANGMRESAGCYGDVEASEAKVQDATSVRHGSPEWPRIMHELACVEERLHTGRQEHIGEMPWSRAGSPARAACTASAVACAAIMPTGAKWAPPTLALRCAASSIRTRFPPPSYGLALTFAFSGRSAARTRMSRPAHPGRSFAVELLRGDHPRPIRARATRILPRSRAVRSPERQ